MDIFYNDVKWYLPLGYRHKNFQQTELKGPKMFGGIPKICLPADFS